MIKKILVYVVALVQLVTSYGLDKMYTGFIDDRVEYNSKTMRVVACMRHGNTGQDGHTKTDQDMGITDDEKGKSRNIGYIISQNHSKLTYATDITGRCKETLNEINVQKNNPIIIKRNSELNIGLYKSDFAFIRNNPGYLYAIVQQFKRNLLDQTQNSFDFINEAIETIGTSAASQGVNILQSFLNVILGNKMPSILPGIYNECSISKISIEEDLLSRLQYIIHICNQTENDILCVHHSMFVSTILFIAKLTETLQANNIEDLYKKMRQHILQNPKTELSKYLDLFVTCFTKYHIKNLDMVYLLYSKTDDMSNFYICNMDYIQKNKLPLYDILMPKTSTPLWTKLSSIVHILCNEPFSALSFVCAKDELKKKDCMLSVKTTNVEIRRECGTVQNSVKYMIGKVMYVLSLTWYIIDKIGAILYKMGTTI